MERPFVPLILAWLAAVLSAPAAPPCRQGMEQAFREGRPDAWCAALQALEDRGNLDPGEQGLLLECYYGTIGWQLRAGRPAEARRALRSARRLLDAWKDAAGESSMTAAYEAAFTGFRIRLNPLLAPFLGPGVLRTARRAVERDPENPYAWIELGNALFHAPAVGGGSKSEAETCYRRALALMEAREDPPGKNWRYAALIDLLNEYFPDPEAQQGEGEGDRWAL